jgi:predicted dinucleotide-binding enzyme
MTHGENAKLHVVLGSGPAGSTLATELVGRGYAVRLVDRRAEGPEKEGIERHAADLRDAGQARDAVSGAEVVYHCVNVPYELQVLVMPERYRRLFCRRPRAYGSWYWIRSTRMGRPAAG